MFNLTWDLRSVWDLLEYGQFNNVALSGNICACEEMTYMTAQGSTLQKVVGFFSVGYLDAKCLDVENAGYLDTEGP